MLKLLESSAGTNVDSTEIVTGFMLKFIKQVLIQVNVQDICENEGDQQFLYCNLAFLNLLMHGNQGSESEIKIKKQKLSMSQKI